MRVRNFSWLAFAIGIMAAAPASAKVRAAQTAQASEQLLDEAAGPESDIVVEAPRLLPVPPENLPTEPTATALATIKIYVLYQDLDLSRTTDVGRLMDRVKATARQACGYLDLLYPLVEDPDCAKRAEANATPAARAAIALAAGRVEGTNVP